MNKTWKPCVLILFGVILIIAGFVMTIVGYITLNDSFCFTCPERPEKDNAKALKIIGPMFLVSGIVVIIFAVYQGCKRMKASVPTGVVTYGAGSIGNTTYPAQAGYPPQYSTPSYPPMHQAHVPPPQANYPPGAGVYQTQAQGYQQPPYPPATGVSYPQTQYPVKAGEASQPPPAYEAATAPSAPLLNNGP